MIWKYNYIKYLAEISKQLNQMNFYENCIYLSGNLSEYWIGNNEIHLKRFSLQRIPNQPIKLYTKLIKFDKFRLINLGEKNKNEFHLMRAKTSEKLHRCECNKVSKTKAAYGKMELILLVFIWFLSFKVPRIGKSPAFVKQHWMQKYNVSFFVEIQLRILIPANNNTKKRFSTFFNYDYSKNKQNVDGLNKRCWIWVPLNPRLNRGAQETCLPPLIVFDTFKNAFTNIPRWINICLFHIPKRMLNIDSIRF